MTRFEAYCKRQRDKWGDKFIPPSDARFIRYFNSGERIRVRTCGLDLTGTVSASGGWAPVFLLMRTQRSIGSMWTLGEREEVLAVKLGRRYVEVSR